MAIKKTANKICHTNSTKQKRSMIYPIIGRQQLQRLNDYVLALDFDQAKAEEQRSSFDIVEPQRSYLATYKLLLLFRFNRQEQKRQQENPSSYTAARGASPGSWTARDCLKELLREGKDVTMALVGQYGTEAYALESQKISDLTIGDLISLLPLILDRSGIKPLG